MKKILIVVIIAILFIFLVSIVSVFLFKEKFKGILPAILMPSQDIAKMIKKSQDASGNGAESPLVFSDNFKISIFAEKLPGARVLALGPDGDMWVSQTGKGLISRLEVKDGEVSSQEIILKNLNNPHGLVFDYREQNNLYIAETDQVSVYNTETKVLKKIFDLPKGGRHFTRTLMWHPDGRLLISIGSSCDVCDEEDDKYASIISINPDGSDMKVVAAGLRNSVFMATHPVTGEVWATEMGRDNLGDDLPPDEINIIKAGKNYGWPTCYGENIHDADFDKNTYIRNPCEDNEPSHIDLPAHSAPLGLAFVPEEGWPEEYWHNLLVAYHGSFNRSEPTGYKIARLKVDANGVFSGAEDFISGWLQNGVNALGRPVDLLIQPGGILYISDDQAGVIYKVAYQPKDDTVDLISVSQPAVNQVITSPLQISGEARGTWYFEATFPVELRDENGLALAQGYAQAQDDPSARLDSRLDSSQTRRAARLVDEAGWMTENFVPFSASIDFDKPTTLTGVLILKKNNASGLPEFDRQIEIPVNFSAVNLGEAKKCVISGCSSQICASEEIATTCEYREEFACYKNAACETQATGLCGWTQTAELTACLEKNSR
ncbi:MAG: PQQ-dependent sugar dehydrogenase [bacterium]|nr:PQQ-dependent sugar dehydrogenase [bacterium]